jgi:hypothetical protein
MVLARFREQVIADSWKEGSEELGDAPMEFFCKPKLKVPAARGAKLCEDGGGGLFRRWDVHML